MKTLGLLGGTSWHSTIEYYRLINEKVGEVIGTENNPPLLIYSLNVELMRSGDWERINRSYLEYSQMLEEAGADAIMICANTPHKVFDFVQPKLGIPILHIADAIIEEARRLNSSQLTLLGTLPTMEERFIADRLELKKINVMIPDKSDRDEIHRIIAEELTQGIFHDNSKNFLISNMEKQKIMGTEGIILGCTELPLIIKTEDVDLPLLNTTDLHCQMGVNFILQ